MTNGVTVSLTVSLILTIVGIIVSGQSPLQCSSFCVCDTWYGLLRASCTSRHLYSIHTGAPSYVQALDLSDNVISSLTNFELTYADLTELKYLNLSKNAISDISLNAFHGLRKLRVLDLSENRLMYILDDTFENNNNLRILRLSNNNFKSHVPKLRSIWLTELSLDSCHVNYLPSDTFNGLTQIRYLDLSNNEMIQMSHTILQRLPVLKNLLLKGNPFYCDKVMHDLERYLNYINVKYDYSCKATGSQKFEKMVILPVTKQRTYHHSAIEEISTKETIPVTKYNVSSILNKNLSTCEQMANQTNIIHSNLPLPYWFLCIGFISGISSGLVICYIWLTGKFSCTRRRRHRDPFYSVSQGLSLLRNSYLRGYIDNDESLIGSCPGTPPPPYRDVMLQPNLYRCPSIFTNLNNNGTGHRESYT
ncbi:PREDICTED: leucine-rich repeat-containing protein 52-like [Habropoda laboriosa]|uniref:leucine-rich repeat-containing protein 52-like n=1 Tax=Habropoda laboriosa TaxID=597456 RepID=UPI00083E4810|nr:PREDICTED: leucine-rich repeat-containing protein 52-like [Habropoda laboriosa]